MKRRAVLRILACGLVASPHPTSAQAPRLPRVVMLASADESSVSPLIESFRRGLRAAGQVEGKTLNLDLRYGGLEPSRIIAMEREAVAEKPDVIVIGGLSAARRLRDLTSTIPVVVATSSDLVDGGVVKSFARPGGNITGISDLVDEAAAKRLELLRAALPHAKRVALLTNPDFPATPKIESRIKEAAPRLGLTIVVLHSRDRASLSAAIESMAQTPPDALLVGGDPLFNPGEFIARANALRVPVIHYWPGTAALGALLSHEADIHDNFHRAAGYVDRILKGAKPGDLPIHQPTRYKLVVNAKTAQSLGLTIPQAVLQRADEVIR